MRVVAGTARGRPLRAPEGRGTRPTSDRVREAIFNILASLGGVEGDTVVDLFAGSGALGIEALSRGAARVVFVDSDPGALRTVRENLDSLGFADAPVTLVRADATRWRLPSGTDVVLVDPPYAFAGWVDLLEALLDVGVGGLAVLESGNELDLPPGWEDVRTRRYGSTVVQVVRPADPAGFRVEPKGGT
jgi:16S rRNA (guanine966-N2)-methyltransferase